METLNLPRYQINVKTNEKGKQVIFDSQRRQFVALTDEEWVRQHFVHLLTDYMGYPPTLLANEVQLSIGEKKLRCDSVLYGTDAKPKMIIEYKAPKVKITQKVFDQISAYNLLLHVDYLIVSNGKETYCFKMDYENETYHSLSAIPRYEEL